MTEGNQAELIERIARAICGANCRSRNATDGALVRLANPITTLVKIMDGGAA
jgi:hypothetical protein